MSWHQQGEQPAAFSSAFADVWWENDTALFALGDLEESTL